MSDTTGKKRGRKPVDDPARTRTVRLTDGVWELLGPDPRGTLKRLAEDEAARRRATRDTPAAPVDDLA